MTQPMDTGLDTNVEPVVTTPPASTTTVESTPSTTATEAPPKPVAVAPVKAETPKEPKPSVLVPKVPKIKKNPENSEKKSMSADAQSLKRKGPGRPPKSSLKSSGSPPGSSSPTFTNTSANAPKRPGRPPMKKRDESKPEKPEKSEKLVKSEKPEKSEKERPEKEKLERLERPERSEKSEKLEKPEPKLPPAPILRKKEVTSASVTGISPFPKEKAASSPVSIPKKVELKEPTTPKLTGPTPKPIVTSPKVSNVKVVSAPSPPKLKTPVKVKEHVTSGHSTPEMPKAKIQRELAPSVSQSTAPVVASPSPMSTLSTPTVDDYKSPKMMNPKFGKKAWILDYQSQETQKAPTSSQKSEQPPVETSMKLPLKKKMLDTFKTQMMESEKTEVTSGAPNPTDSAPSNTSSPPSQVVEVSTPPISTTSISETPTTQTPPSTFTNSEMESTSGSELQTSTPPPSLPLENTSKQVNSEEEIPQVVIEPSVTMVTPSMETTSPPMTLSPIASVEPSSLENVSEEPVTMATQEPQPLQQEEEYQPQPEEAKPVSNGMRTGDDSMDIDDDDMGPTNILYVSGTPNSTASSTASSSLVPPTTPTSMMYNNGVGTIPGIHPWSYGTGPLQFFPPPTYKAPTYPMPYQNAVPQGTLDGLQNTGQQFSQYPHRAT